MEKNQAAEEKGNWTQIISSEKSFFSLNLRELWRYRDLVLLLVRRDIIAIYKQTVLGPLWYVIQPILTTIIFTVIFGRVAKLGPDNVPHILFYLAGVINWQFFANCITKTSKTFIVNAPIFGKVYFPRLAVPVSVVLSNIIQYFVQFAMFMVFWLSYWNNPHVSTNSNIWLVPVLIVIMAMLGMGIGIIISSLTTKYRDLQFLVVFGVQLFMYATPVIYPLSIMPEKYKIFILANPMTSVIEGFRYAFLGTGGIDYLNLLYSAGVAVVLCLIGMMMFTRIEKTFMDTV